MTNFLAQTWHLFTTRGLRITGRVTEQLGYIDLDTDDE